MNTFKIMVHNNCCHYSQFLYFAFIFCSAAVSEILIGKNKKQQLNSLFCCLTGAFNVFANWKFRLFDSVNK